VFSPLVALTFKFFDALHRPRAERGRVASNRDFPSTLNLRHPPIECGNELAQLTEHIRRCHSHRGARRRAATVRDTFQLSPQSVHRQSRSSDGFVAAVTVAVDPQFGHFSGNAVTADEGPGSFNSGSVEVLW
jgi:hypothetical protein